MNSFQHNKEYFFTSYTIQNPSLIFSSLLLIGISIELASIYFVYKTKFHSIWGSLLILLHVLILLFIGPDFSIQILVVAIFFIGSPFRKNSEIVKEFRHSINLIKKLFTRRKKNGIIVIYYDENCNVCSRFLNILSYLKIQENIKFTSQASLHFEQLLQKNHHLKEVRSIVTEEINGDRGQKIRIKGDAITSILAYINFGFIVIRYAYYILPLPVNLIYDTLVVFLYNSEGTIWKAPSNKLLKLLNEHHLKS